MQQFQIRQSDSAQTRVVEAPEPDVADREALARVQHFGFTANNVTYSVLGESFGYWRFFPAADDTTEEWGVVPVWGYAEVVASRAATLEVGERLFGFFPAATHLLMRPEGDPGRQVVDTAPHRASLPAAYNSYQRVPAPSGSDQTSEDLRMLLYPLYLTSWAIGDMLDEEGWFDAEQVLVASASSKTAIGFAYAARAASDPPSLVGLTSATNRAWVESLDLYDRVVVYDEIEAVIEPTPSVIVDMAGNGALLGRLHVHLGEAMRRTVSVGITHWEQLGAHADVIGERTEFFFAPSVIAKRIKQWGAGEFARRTESFLREAADASSSWLRLEASVGIEAMPEVYAAARSGSVDPASGPIIRV